MTQFWRGEIRPSEIRPSSPPRDHHLLRNLEPMATASENGDGGEDVSSLSRPPCGRGNFNRKPIAPGPRPNPADHLGLLGEAAKMFVGRGMRFNELINAGYPGLLRACELYEENIGVQFSTYAMKSIIHWIHRAVRVEPRLIRVPPFAIDLALKEIRAREKGFSFPGDSPPAPASDSDLSPSACAARVILMQRTRFVPGTPGEDRVEKFVPVLETIATGEYESGSLDEDTIKCLYESIDKLRPRESMVIRLRYDLAGRGRPFYQREIASELNISNERVRQIERIALRRLREILTSNGIEG
jgi:RNA polymerase sigma factor (sigma-70 family)